MAFSTADAPTGAAAGSAEDRSSLEQERDFLLASLQDLDREHAAGDVAGEDYRLLRDDYVARAARVLRAIESGGTDPRVEATASPLRGRLVTVAVVVLVAVVAGLLMMQASGRRGAGETVSGLDVRSAGARARDCLASEASDPDAALSCYSAVLAGAPQSVDALALRGWLQVRRFDVAAGLDDLDDALLLEPADPTVSFWRAVGRQRAGDVIGALDDLAVLYAADPTDDERQLALEVTVAVLPPAVEACVRGDVSATLPADVIIGCYENALLVAPGYPPAELYLGWLLARFGQPALGLGHLDVALTADADLSQGYLFRAMTRGSLGRTDEAIADLDTFDALTGVPADQRLEAERIRADLAAGRDPLAAARPASDT